MVASGGYGLPMACCFRSCRGRCPCAKRVGAMGGSLAEAYRQFRIAAPARLARLTPDGDRQASGFRRRALGFRLRASGFGSDPDPFRPEASSLKPEAADG